MLLWEDVYAVADKYFAPLEGEGCEDGGELGDLLAGGATVDLVVMSPPWGGPDYSLSEEFDLRSMLSCGGDGDGFRLLKEAIRIAKNVVYVLPRNTKLKQLKELAAEVDLPCRVETILIGKKAKMILALFGAVFELRS